MEQNSIDLLLLLVAFMAAMSLPIWIGIVAIFRDSSSS
jgi:hypothetical protein